MRHAELKIAHGPPVAPTVSELAGLRVSKGSQAIASLDGLRAVAIVVVFFSHAPGLPHPPGGFGVTIFFFLSGFLITTLLRREIDESGHLSIKNFYLRRAVRIFPPMYVTLVLVLIASVAGAFARPVPPPEAIASQALHLTNYYLIAGRGEVLPGLNVFWSLAVEEHFYLVFPLLSVFMFRWLSRKAHAACLAALCVVVLLWRIWLWRNGCLPIRLMYGSDTRIDSILFGAILALAFNPVIDPPRLKNDLLALGALLVPLLLIVVTIAARGNEFRETYRYSIQGVLLMPIYYVLISRAKWPLIRWLNHPYVRFVGVISYSFYLVHNAFLQLAMDRMVPIAGNAISVIVSASLALGYAAVMHVVVEKPLLAVRRRLRV